MTSPTNLQTSASTSDPRPDAADRCPRCGALNGCAMAAGSAAPCWCADRPPLPAAQVQAWAEAQRELGRESACLCPACIAQVALERA